MNWRVLAITDIKTAEACRLEAYLDSEGIWTIGWGHTYAVQPGWTCDQARADEWFEQDFAQAEISLNRNVYWWINCPPNIRRGLVNMCYNLGWPRLSKFKNMLAAGAAGNWNKMADEALDSKWSSQVGDRAIHITELFRSANQLELMV